jgi:hypothetical protein
MALAKLSRRVDSLKRNSENFLIARWCSILRNVAAICELARRAAVERLVFLEAGLEEASREVKAGAGIVRAGIVRAGIVRAG